MLNFTSSALSLLFEFAAFIKHTRKQQPHTDGGWEHYTVWGRPVNSESDEYQKVSTKQERRAALDWATVLRLRPTGFMVTICPHGSCP
jgi:hypothetical protein